MSSLSRQLNVNSCTAWTCMGCRQQPHKHRSSTRQSDDEDSVKAAKEEANAFGWLGNQLTCVAWMSHIFFFGILCCHHEDRDQGVCELGWFCILPRNMSAFHYTYSKLQNRHLSTSILWPCREAIQCRKARSLEVSVAQLAVKEQRLLEPENCLRTWSCATLSGHDNGKHRHRFDQGWPTS